MKIEPQVNLYIELSHVQAGGLNVKKLRFNQGASSPGPLDSCRGQAGEEASTAKLLFL